MEAGSEPQLSPQAGGMLRQLLVLFFPIALMTLSGCSFLLIEKLWFARVSAQAMEAAVSSTYAAQIFQASCVALATMAQVCVGRWTGENQLKNIGPGTWQFIWFSFLSMLITFPVGMWYGGTYFRGTSIEGVAIPYYTLLMASNFLYPLATTLGCFYLGQGKTRLVLFVTVGTQVIKLALAYLLIFGWGKWIPAYGILGGAWSTVLTQAALCLILFSAFLRHRETHHSTSWVFQPRLFWECIYPGLLRMSSRILSFTSWASLARLMTIRGGDYLLILSIGGTIAIFLSFLSEAICQAQITIVSYTLGKRAYEKLRMAFRSATYLAAIISLAMSIPLLLFPVAVFEFLFPALSLSAGSIPFAFVGLWASCSFYVFSFVPVSYILAYKDMKFPLFTGAFSWINGYLVVRIALEKFSMPADAFWLVLSIMHGSHALLYLWRARVLIRRSEKESVRMIESYKNTPVCHKDLMGMDNLTEVFQTLAVKDNEVHLAKGGEK